MARSGAPRLRLRWRLVRSAVLLAALGVGYATLATLEVQPAEERVELDGDAVGSNKNQKSSTNTSTQSSNTKTTYTYELSTPINSQLQISPIP